MKTLLLIFTISLGLSACNSSTSSIPNNTAYAQDQVYEGYPCGDACDQFKSGYDNALKNGIKDPAMCQGSEEVVLGCKAFVTDYLYDSQSYDKLVNGFKK